FKKPPVGGLRHLAELPVPMNEPGEGRIELCESGLVRPLRPERPSDLRVAVRVERRPRELVELPQHLALRGLEAADPLLDERAVDEHPPVLHPSQQTTVAAPPLLGV